MIFNEPAIIDFAIYIIKLVLFFGIAGWIVVRFGAVAIERRCGRER